MLNVLDDLRKASLRLQSDAEERERKAAELTRDAVELRALASATMSAWLELMTGKGAA